MSAAPSDDEILEVLRRLHEDGERYAARHALEWCAGRRIVMPQWLCDVVLRAVRLADLGRDDELLGPRADRKREYLRRRDAAIRRIDEALAIHQAEGTGVTKSKLIEATARTHNLSVKAVEKIIYRPHKKPTSTRPK